MKKGIYVIPSLLTLANLAAGVMAILFAANGRYSAAAWAIIFGICMDMMDGRIARWMGATSQFGLELDSLADVITFGVAPGILMYQFALVGHGRPGYMIAIFFAMASALRLARFNLRAQQSAEPTTYFVGLPVPAAAGILASFVLSYELFGSAAVTVKTIPMLMMQMPLFFQMIPLTMLILSFLMISQVHYGDFKKLKLGRPKSLQSLSVIAAGLLLVFTYPQNTIFIVFSLYVLSGLWMFAWRFYHSRRTPPLARLFGRRSTDRVDEVLAAGPSAPPKEKSSGFN
ncbi:MAG: CDP-diacylglycerol--serine O-phosphatidyltransferase [Elusimicrobia bacterium RIFCSPLOWO2_01_FULL_59_12]|nr:MAG: CDP-diacylglycerol--serine O-phosphatidyltransferase [Elusimicrobia bacterium RIFCSPLOWO2_01_FULL_59_12]